MKIIYVANIRFPTEKAHGWQIAKMCESFAKLGVDLELWVPKRRNNLKIDPFTYYGVKKNFKIGYFWTLDLLFLSRFVPRIFFYLATKTFLHSLAREIKAKKPELVYSRDWLTVKGLFKFKVPVVWEVHTLPKQVQREHREILAKSAGVIVITQSLRQILLGHKVPEKKVLLARDAVDVEKFQIFSAKLQVRKDLNLPQDKKIVMYAGNFFAWKGVYLLADAAKEFSTRTLSSVRLRPDEGEEVGVVFVFVGGSPVELKKFTKYLEQKNLKNIILIGHAPHPQIPKYLAAADVLVLPNSAKSEISRLYTSPLKLFEYLAAGRPIVAADLPSIREMLSEETAVFFVPDDPASLGGALRQVLQDRELSAKLSRNGWNLVQNFTWEKRAKAIMDFINANLYSHPNL